MILVPYVITLSRIWSLLRHLPALVGLALRVRQVGLAAAAGQPGAQAAAAAAAGRAARRRGALAAPGIVRGKERMRGLELRN